MYPWTPIGFAGWTDDAGVAEHSILCYSLAAYRSRPVGAAECTVDRAATSEGLIREHY